MNQLDIDFIKMQRLCVPIKCDQPNFGMMSRGYNKRRERDEGSIVLEEAVWLEKSPTRVVSHDVQEGAPRVVCVLHRRCEAEHAGSQQEDSCGPVASWKWRQKALLRQESVAQYERAQCVVIKGAEIQ